jgi:protoporphyrinogen oxidase
MKVGIIGAGPAGLTAAYRLQQLGAEVVVFEAAPLVGGMGRSIDLWGQRVDIGPHRFFTSDPRVDGVWQDVVGDAFGVVRRKTRIYYRRRFFDYPLRPGNVVANLGPVDVVRCLWSYLREQARRSRPDGPRSSFEDWVVQHFGRRLFEMFFKSYTEKLWGIPCTELDSDFAAQRIKGFSLGHSVLAAFGLGRTRFRTLVDEFRHPKAGSGYTWERMASRITAGGGTIRLSSPVAKIMSSGRHVTGIETTGGDAWDFDHVVSSMPLTLLVTRLADIPPDVLDAVQRLRFRNTILVYLKVESSSLFPDQWVYIHAEDVAVGRVTNFRNWVPELYGGETATILALEFWCYDDDAIWRETDAALIDLAMREIRSVGLVADEAIAAGHVVRVPRSYPVYARGYGETLAPVITFLRSYDNLWPIGRYGSFKYNNQDHSMLMGLLAAENIVLRRGHDLWSVNTDYEAYQEETEA